MEERLVFKQQRVSARGGILIPDCDYIHRSKLQIIKFASTLKILAEVERL